jgi:SAM-dependent methyltransferase
LKVGCGHGCSLYPLLLDLPGIERYYATDYSPDALNIMTHHAEYDASRITSTLWDFTRPPPETLPQVEAVLCVFVMSAITPMMHKECLDNVASVLIPGGYLLFRDYGVCDMTMYRHSYCHEKYLFERTDGTYAYYFSIEYIEDLVARSGHFRVLELEYATVFMRNRKSETTGRRVFVHGVLQKL